MGSEVAAQQMNWSGYAAISITEVFIPAGPWRTAQNLTGLKGYGEMRGKTGNFQAKPAVQVANDVRTPGASTAAGVVITADGVSDPNGVQPVNSGSFKYARAGWLISLSSGTTLGFASLTGVVELIYG